MVSNHTDEVRKAKAHLDFNLVRDLKGNKKHLHKYTDSKRKTEENMDPLLNRVQKLLTRDRKGPDTVLFLASVFTSNIYLQGSQTHETVQSPEQGILILSGGGSH